MDVTGQQPVIEATAIDQTPETTPDSLAPKFAALAKKEKWIRKLTEDVKRQQEELKKKDLEYQTSYVPKSRIKEDFLNVAMDAGLTPDQIANILLSQSPQQQIDPTVLEMKNQIKALQAKLEETTNNFSNKEKTQYEQAVNQVRADATKLINSDPSFEDLRSDEYIAKVVDYIKSTYEEDGVVLSVNEAAQEFKDALIEDTFNRVKTSKTLQEKLRSLMGQQAQEQEKQQPPLTLQSHQKTLTNGMVPSSKPKLTPKQRAMMRMQGLDPDAVSV